MNYITRIRVNVIPHAKLDKRVIEITRRDGSTREYPYMSAIYEHGLLRLIPSSWDIQYRKTAIVLSR